MLNGNSKEIEIFGEKLVLSERKERDKYDWFKVGHDAGLDPGGLQEALGKGKVNDSVVRGIYDNWWWACQRFEMSLKRNVEKPPALWKVWERKRRKRVERVNEICTAKFLYNNLTRSVADELNKTLDALEGIEASKNGQKKTESLESTPVR